MSDQNKDTQVSLIRRAMHSDTDALASGAASATAENVYLDEKDDVSRCTDAAGEPTGQDPRVASRTAYLMSRHKVRNFVAFLLLGFINNFHYCVVLAAAKQIADHYGMKSLTPLVSWANIAGGCVIRMANAFAFNKVPYHYRFTFAAIQILAGVLIVSLAPYCGSSDPFRFAMSLVGIFCIGNGSNYGESVALGFLEQLAPHSLGGWSSGTGFSGVVSAIMYLGLSSIPGMTNTFIFLLTTPTVGLYLFVYFRVIAMAVPDETLHSEEATETGAASPTESAPSTAGIASEANALVVGDETAADGYRWRTVSASALPWGPPRLCDRAGADEDDDAAGALATHAHTNADGRSARNDDGGDDDDMEAVEPPGCCFQVIQRLLPGVPLRGLLITNRLILWNAVNLMLVYVFEYGVQFMAPYAFPDSADKSKAGHGTATFTTRHAFVITQFCYQSGVLLSRSSLSVMRTKRVEVLTLIQLVNFVCWVVQAKTKLLSSDDDGKQRGYNFALFVWMVGVGLLGGASYVNCFYNILNDTVFPAKVPGVSGAQQRGLNWKELAMNVGALYATAGITMGSLLDVVFANTFI